MAIRIPDHLDRKHFEKLLSGHGQYVPRKVKDALKEAGYGRYLTKPKLTQREVMRALKTLRGEKLSPRDQPDYALYRAVAKELAKLQTEAAQAEKSKHVRAAIREDIAREVSQDPDYSHTNPDEKDPRGIEYGEDRRITQERKGRQERFSKEKARQERYYKAKGIDPKRPDLRKIPGVDMNKIQDMDIG